MATSPLVPQPLERFLELSTDREQIVASNMANVDTPGFRTKDLDFTHEMARASSSGEDFELTPVVRRVQGLLERPDGNNVNLDRESLLLAQSQLQYQIGIQLVKVNFHELLSAIKGGD